MKLYIKSSLDLDQLRNAAKESRTSHLFNLLDEQNSQERGEYTEYIKRYVLTYLRTKLDSEINEIQQDVISICEEYNLDLIDVLDAISRSLQDLEGKTVGNNLTMHITDGDELQFAGEGGANYVIFWTDDKLYAKIDWGFSTYLSNLVSLCHDSLDVAESKGEKLLDTIIDQIKNIVTSRISSYLKYNPPKLQ